MIALAGPEVNPLSSLPLGELAPHAPPANPTRSPGQHAPEDLPAEQMHRA